MYGRNSCSLHLRRTLCVERLEPRRLLATGPVLSEFMAVNNLTLQDQDGDFSDWLEIHNGSVASTNLNGWYLTDDNTNLTRWQLPDIPLGADDYLIVFASDKDRTNPLDELHANFRLSGGGEYLALIEPDGITVASEFSPQYPSQVSDVSFGVSADGMTTGYFTSPTPGAVNSNSPLADPNQRVIVSEIMYHPSSENDLEEFIELSNQGPAIVDVAGWQVSNGVSFTLPSATIAPGEYLVIAADVATFNASYPSVTNVVGGWDGRLSNQTETIEITDNVGRLVDRLIYADAGDWSERVEGPVDAGHQGWVWADDHDGGGKSLELINPVLSNDHGQNWGASAVAGGTPGGANSVADADVAPLILDVSQFPVIPRSVDPVTVTAKLVDELSTGMTATLYWRVDGSPNFTAYPLYDTGKQEDGNAGDGVVGAILPAQPDGTVVEFYLEASDSLGNTRTWPAPTQPTGQQLTNLLYQVDDNFDPAPLTTSDSQPVLRIIMTEAERAELEDIGDGPLSEALSNAQMNATFVRADASEVQVRYNVGVRNRGNGTRVASGNLRNNYRVNFAHDRPLDGITALTLNARGTPDQILGSAIHRLAGIAAADARPVQVRVNGQDLAVAGDPMYGVYVELESLDSDLANHHFPLDGNGNLYRVKDENIVSGGELSYEGTNPDNYRDTYFKQTNEATDDWSDLIQLTNVLNNAPDATFLTDISQVINVEQWMRYLALDSLLGNLEGGLPTGRGDDFAMYRGVLDPRFVLMPYDLDTLFTAGNETRDIFTDYVNVTGLTRLLTHPESRPLYFQAFRDLINTVFNSETLNPLIDQLLGDFVPTTERDTIKQFIASRIDSVLAQLDQQPSSFTVTSGLPVLGEFHRTTTAAAELNGTSDPLTTQSVRVDGQLAGFDAPTGNWSIGNVVGGQLDTLVSTGATWDFLDNGTDQGTAWRDPNFVIDANWGSGPAELGYGDNDEATLVSFGPSSTNKYITTYFRHTFNVTNPAQYDTATLRLLRDDGAAVYLNGTEVVRDNLAAGANYLTLATVTSSPGVEDTFFTFSVGPALLVDGANVLAVEVHQRGPDSSDLSLDLDLTAETAATGTGIAVHPGVNRIVVEAFDGPAGTGALVDNGFLDIWYDDGSEQTISGTISDPSGTVVWSPAAGPYRVTANATVPVGQKLIIQPGTSVYFDQDTELLVEGVLDAQGTPLDRIRFTSVPNAPLVPDLPAGNPGLPAGPPRWDGIHFTDTMSVENIISFADVDYAQNNNGAIGVIRSEAVIDNVTWRGTHLRMVYADDASLIVRNSIFPDMFADNESPAALGLNNISEHVKSVGTAPAGGHFIIQNNIFGTNRGHNDVIDADSNRVPDPIVQILDNVFMGAGDEHLDLGGDVYVAGNVFRNIFKDDESSDTGYASVISTGDAGTETTIVVARNVFWEVDHAINLKQNTATVFENNTVFKVHDDFIDVFGNPNVGSVINLYVNEPGATSGRGAYVEGNIFADLPRVFGNADLPGATTSLLELNRNYVDPNLDDVSIGSRPESLYDLGVDNVQGNPRFVDQILGDFSLVPESAARGSGPLGQDFGALVPSGAWIAGEPPVTTGQTDATLSVGGPGIFAYQFRINGSPWSSVIPIGNGFDPVNGTERTSQIALSGLPDGSYTVEVLGQDFAGVWQQDPTVSNTWTVDSTLPRLVINEVLADNAGALDHFGTQPDVIELHNAGGAPLDLMGMSLSDDPTLPTKFVFASSEIIQPGAHLLLYANSEDGTSGIHLGFSLNADGDAVYLYDTLASGGALLDSLEFGFQLPGSSLGRVGHQEQWVLTTPTLGTDNIAQPTGDWESLKINEWFARGDQLLADDFVEIHNPTSLPVPLGGLYFSDEPAGDPTMHPIAPLSFIAANGYRRWKADGNVTRGNDHLSFRLSSNQEIVSLLDGGLNPIDSVIFFAQTPDDSQGRSPNGSPTVIDLQLPTPAAANEQLISSSETLIEITDVWSYDDSGTDLGTDWKQPGFVDSMWSTGPGVLGFDPDALPSPINTTIPLGDLTYHFRRHFTLTTDPSSTVVTFNTLIDDGAVFHVNGMEVARLGMPAGQPNYQTLANRTIGVASFEGSFTVPSSALVPGDNVIAVEVHQHSTNSSDFVFGLEMDASSTTPDPTTAESQALLDGLRVTEVMYNPFSVDPLEYVELQNVGTELLDLTGVRFADGIRFAFPSQIVNPGELVVVVQDQSAFESFYGMGFPVVGEYGITVDQISLNNGGEVVRLEDALGRTIQQFTYNDQGRWPGRADGKGSSLEVIDTSGNFDDPNNWRNSTEFHGSPGVVGSGPINDVVINEVLTHTDLPSEDALEIYNTTGNSIDLANWYISDSNNNYFKFQVTGGSTVLGPGDYRVFDETQLGFGFKGSEADDAWLIEADASGNPLRFVDHAQLDAAHNGESFGRWPNGNGRLYPMISTTLDAANSGPRVGPLVISEVHYHPPDPGGGIDADMLEFVEIFNPTPAAVDLTNWTINGLGFGFPAGTMLGPGGVLVVVPFDPVNDADRIAEFEAEFGVDIGSSSALYVGPFLGLVDNGGERLTLLSDDDPPPGSPTAIPQIVEDQADFDDNIPWPISADAGGDALHRNSSIAWGNDAANWNAGSPTPGGVQSSVVGDLNLDLLVGADDIDLLYANLGSSDPAFDLDGDMDADRDDVATLVYTVLQRRVGDADLDADVDLIDHNTVLVENDPWGVNSFNGWADGNFDGDDDVDFTDAMRVVLNYAPLGYNTLVATSLLSTRSLETPVESSAAVESRRPTAEIPLRSAKVSQSSLASGDDMSQDIEWRADQPEAVTLPTNGWIVDRPSSDVVHRTPTHDQMSVDKRKRLDSLFTDRSNWFARRAFD